MRKLFVLAVLIAVSAFLLTGCTGSERLKNMTVVQGISFDSAQQGVAVTVQYLDLTKGSGKNVEVAPNITATVSAQGDSMMDAVKRAGKKLPDKLFFGQNKLIVVSDEFEKQYRGELHDYLVKNTESRPDVYILRSRGKASYVLKNAQKHTRVPADSVCKQLEKSKNDVTVSEYLAGDTLPYYP